MILGLVSSEVLLLLVYFMPDILSQKERSS